MKNYQFVKTYSTYCTVETAVTEINKDLQLHPEWSIVTITYAQDNHVCIVVYNVSEPETLENIIKRTNVYPDLVLPTIDSRPAECANCQYKDGMKDALGNLTFGDSPCQWCKYYPWKITCSDAVTPPVQPNPRPKHKPLGDGH